MPVTYKESTYSEVLCWTADTKIKYAPNPKRGKSFVRYAKYEKARTPAEAMKMGSYAQDLFFDFEHGHIKVLGGTRRKQALNPDEETDAWTPTDKMLARMHRSWKTWTKTFSVAEDLGVDRRQITSDKTGGESTEMRAGRLAANEMAKMILKEAEETKRKISDRDVVAVLRMWGFKDNMNRSNVMKEGVNFVHSDTLGLVASYDGAVLITAATTEYSNVTQVLSRWLTDRMPSEFGEHGFGWTSINVNANYAGALHRDANNEGPSFIKAFGSFTGGQLNYWGDDNKAEGTVESLCKPADKSTLDINKNLLLFDGNRGHSVEDFQGERFSLVYFCTGQWRKANKTVQSELEKCGINFPTKESMSLGQKLLGTPRGYKALASSRAAKGAAEPAAKTWPVAAGKAEGTDFLAEERKQEARAAVRDMGAAPECNDEEFTGYRVAYSTLPDRRRRCCVYLVGVSGGERLAVSGDEDRVGSGHYAYKKAETFPLGPPLETPRIGDVRAWCAELVSTPGPQCRKKMCLRSYANAADGQSKNSLKRPAGAAGCPLAKQQKRPAAATE